MNFPKMETASKYNISSSMIDFGISIISKFIDKFGDSFTQNWGPGLFYYVVMGKYVCKILVKHRIII